MQGCRRFGSLSLPPDKNGFFKLLFASKTHTKKEKKLDRINKWIKPKKSKFTHLHAILTNIKLD